MMPFVETSYFEFGFISLLIVVFAMLGRRIQRAILIQRRSKIGLVDLINKELPQTQCGHCGHEGCLPYARAIAAGDAINKCVPGGLSAIRRLSRLLNQQNEMLDPAHGVLAPRAVAIIREAECIGCTKCIQACPVDAILGAPKLMHSVIENECTGCDLCVAPCPVDCIDMLPANLHVRQFPMPAFQSDELAPAMESTSP